jgi:hypothetical protein
VLHNQINICEREIGGVEKLIHEKLWELLDFGFIRTRKLGIWEILRLFDMKSKNWIFLDFLRYNSNDFYLNLGFFTLVSRTRCTNWSILNQTDKIDASQVKINQNPKKRQNPKPKASHLSMPFSCHKNSKN